MSVLISIGAFIVALGVLITVHEFGHYWVAKKLGVKVLRFSIGFGKPLWKRVAGTDQTEYVIAAFPLGGYVKMLDEREAEVPANELSRAFNRKPLASRTAIVLAGPLFNFLLAIIAFWGMYVIGIPGIKPIIGELEPDSVAELAGIELGDEILKVNDKETPTWSAAGLAMVPAVLNKQEVTIELQDQYSSLKRVTIDVSAYSSEMGESDLLVLMGMRPYQQVIPAIIGEVIQGGVAEQAGLKPDDKLISADGNEITDWMKWVDYVRARPDMPIVLELERDGVVMTITMTPAREKGKEGDFGRIGAGVSLPDESSNRFMTIMRYNPFEAIPLAVSRTWDMSVMTLQVLSKIVVGEVSVKNISGPITIAKYAGRSAYRGLATFLNFIAIVSVSLFVLNMLPIPLLDGGHLLYYLLEAIKGSPVSEAAQLFGQKIGILILTMLMSLALYNDLERLFN
jgi:regulator of sigma E protease